MRTTHSPPCTASGPGPRISISCPASDTPMPGRPAISPCRRRRASPSHCRFARTRRRCRRWRSRGGHGARSLRASCGAITAWRRRPRKRRASSARVRRSGAFLHDQNAAPLLVENAQKRAAAELRRADVDHPCAGLTERPAAAFFDCRRPNQMWKAMSTGSAKPATMCTSLAHGRSVSAPK